MFEKVTQFLHDSRSRLAIALLLGVCGIFLSISFVSFFASWADDQSELLNKSSWEILFSSAQNIDPATDTAEPIEIQNAGSALGAIIAKKFIHDWFGIGAFAVVLLCFFFAAKALNVKTNISSLRITFILISTMLMSSITLGFFCNDLFDGNIGGCFGYYFSYQLLRNIFGSFITALIIIVCVMIYVIFTFHSVMPFMQTKWQNFLLKHKKQPIAISTSEQVQSEEITETEQVPEQTTPEQEPITEITEEEIEEQTTSQIPFTFTQPQPEEESQNETPEISDEPEQDNDSTEVVSDQDDTLETEEEPITEVENSEEIADEPAEDEISLDPNDEDKPEIIDEDEKNIGGMNVVNTNAGVEDTSDVEMVMQDYDPKADLSHFKQPDTSLLKMYDNDIQTVQIDEEEQLENKNLIETTLLNFGIEIESISATIGPTITLYEIVPKAGTRISKIQSLEKDIMMSLKAEGIRIIAPIPGKGTIGIEVPNKKKQVVSMYSVLNSKAFKESTMELPVAMGKTITNEVYMFDLAKMPHLLVAGATGQGKSVGLNAIITSLLYKKHPSQLKFVLVDPKMVEFNLYADLENHYMAQYPGEENIIITDCAKVLQTLKSLVEEMEDRYRLLMAAHCRNIIEYNDKFIHRQLNPNNGHKYLSYIVIIIDEFGDFIMQAGKEIETPIARIAQKARAVGMHLILATQRPSVNVITGLIKANVPGRIAFRTASGIDSNTILDARGAEGLVGRGDLLISKGGGTPERVQCAFVDTPEVESIVKFIKNQQSYGQAMQLPEIKEENNNVNLGESKGGDSGPLDECFEDAARVIVGSKTGSTSALQRKFSLGYNRAGRIMDQLEKYGIVGPYNGSKAREVLMDDMGLDQLLQDLRDRGILKN